MSKHTQGPWKLLDFEEREAYVVTNSSGTKGLYRGIAEILYGYNEPAESEQHANARLISAAPELLEALKELLAAETALFPAAEHGVEAQSAWATRRSAAEDAARAVIAKATGEA